MEENNQVKRNLKQRHITMIALGGTIGTGLFLTSGATISQAGPFGSVLAYIFIGIMVYFVMTSLGEMATYLPTSGSFSDYGSRYVYPAFGFALGWNYWLNGAITIAVDLTTAGMITQFWFPHIHAWIFSGIATILIFVINVLAVKAFGETEYWLSTIKVITIVIFLIVGVATIWASLTGHNGNIDVVKNLTAGNHGFIGGVTGFVGVLLIAGFSFQGTELLGVTAGESENPEKSIPKAMNSIFWRILLFYIFTIIVIAAIINYKDPRLLNPNSTAVMSPFTIVFKNIGFALAASVMNAVILTSVVSSANSVMYASTRILYSLGQDHGAPKVFGRTAKNGIPVVALLATSIICFITFLTGIFGTQIYLFLVDLSSLTGFLAWLGISISHVRFRRAYVAQGKDLNDLPYKAKLFPFGPLLAILMTAAIMINLDPQQLFSPQWGQALATYAALPMFILLYFGYKWTHNTKIIPLEEVDLSREK
ncbi:MULTISPECIES: amino acid permease [unclassified Lactococcus]|uniref:amino acid permease n=1 Tax=unclassified Lactococcus TaxID=2643510 RepID=UPI0011CB390D|nr:MULTISPECIES: amino acid permease [unclassified Lactococcus]MQW23516.1 amino acid permease [Lactococcus sp. dk101]TXK37846.1 amino acid permease [Lactococcus sp. dk310]TXK49296.1 amino acid permease [Lactococcus sp. dk322]